MVDISPSQALFAALSNNFAAARQGQGQGVGSAIPGLAGLGASDSPSNTPGSTGGASLGGGVPSTATTGQSVANSLLGGVGGTRDAVAQQVAGTLLNQRQPGERGDLGAGVTGGNVGALLSVLGGLGAIPSILGSLVASDASGLPLNPSLLNPTSLADLVSGESSPGFGSEFGGAFNSDGSFTPAVSTTGGSGTVNTIRQGIGGSRSEIDRGRSSGGGPNRGARNAGNRGR